MYINKINLMYILSFKLDICYNDDMEELIWNMIYIK